MVEQFLIGQMVTAAPAVIFLPLTLTYQLRDYRPKQLESGIPDMSNKEIVSVNLESIK
jgi:hypothetical protein